MSCFINGVVTYLHRFLLQCTIHTFSRSSFSTKNVCNSMLC